MLGLKRTSQFKKDFKKATKQNKNVEHLKEVIAKLSNQEPLETKYQDHPLSGDLKDFRDCHIEPDWVLIYQIKGDELKLIRVGSHSELFKS
ncbi:MAG: type II toxin-antitoxin system YafQ family toxin [Ignavibacteria bacterium]|jgi:mRNA interferase YafQ